MIVLSSSGAQRLFVHSVHLLDLPFKDEARTALFEDPVRTAL